MKIQRAIGLWAVLGAGLVGVSGHAHAADGEQEVPLHERPFVQDSVEELERKWSFEVRSLLFHVWMVNVLSSEWVFCVPLKFRVGF